MRSTLSYVLSCLAISMCLTFTNAQVEEPKPDEPTDDLGNVSDAFQEHFFEALKQKAIENYELAIDALHKAKDAASGNVENIAVVNFEMGKNLVQLKRYDEAKSHYNAVLSQYPDKLDVLEAMYDLHYLERDYSAAITIVKELIMFDSDYKEDLANLYSRTEQYEEAIKILDELDDEFGESDYRNGLRAQIYKKTGNTGAAIENLEEKINRNAKSEKDYLNLIFLYSEQGDSKKAFETAQELLRNKPDSKLVHLALYKFYLDDGNIEKAIESMKIALNTSDVEKENKYKVIGDFIGFVEQNPTYEKALEEIVLQFAGADNGRIYEDMGNYYLAKERKNEALKFYEKGVAGDPDNFSLLKNTLLLQVEFEKYDAATKLSEQALEIFPAQPLLYLVNGVANIELNNPDRAIDSLELGVDYLFDDPKMEKDFYEQLSRAYGIKGDDTKAKHYATRASNIKMPN